MNIIDISKYDKVYFFGDKCDEDGNDYPLYCNENIIGYHVKDPENTLEILNNMF